MEDKPNLQQVQAGWIAEKKGHGVRQFDVGGKILQVRNNSRNLEKS